MDGHAWTSGCRGVTAGGEAYGGIAASELQLTKSVENVPSGSCEKIGFANFASDLKCIPTSQTSFIGDSEQKFARLNSHQIREIDFFTASCPRFAPTAWQNPCATPTRWP